MAEPSKSKRNETREFWEAAICLWAESHLSVREFCKREGLAEHAFYSWRREWMLETPTPKVKQEPTAVHDRAVPIDDRRRRPSKLNAVNSSGATTSAVEFLPVRVVGDEVSGEHVMPAGAATGAASIEIVGTSSWRVRILAGFNPTTLENVLTVLERRSC